MYPLANIIKIYIALISLIFISSCGGGGDSETGGSGGGAGTQNHIVSATAGTGGTISPASRTVANGQTTTFTVSASTGYSISSVSGCGGSLSGNTYTTGAVTSACAVNASFSLNSYTVTATAGEGGSITPASQTVNHGESASFNIIPNEHYEIDLIHGCPGQLNNNNYVLSPLTEPCAIEVSFQSSYAAPGHFMAESGDSSAVFSWSEVPDATEYRIYYSTEPDFFKTLSSSPHEVIAVYAAPHKVTSLINFSDYYAVIRAFINGVESKFSHQITFKPEKRVYLSGTGISFCADMTTNFLECPVSGFEGQDGDHGRNKMAREGTLPKVGAGAGAFDFTKLDSDGSDLPASAEQWSCVRDNHTGLTWEVKTHYGRPPFTFIPGHLMENFGLHDVDHVYSWFDSDMSRNGGNTGSQQLNCPEWLKHQDVCDTDAFVQKVNNIGLCGASDWRLPTRAELLSLIFLENLKDKFFNPEADPTPSVDTDYFPYNSYSNTKLYWTSSTSPQFANHSEYRGIHALSVGFQGGVVNGRDKSNFLPVRLVRYGGMK